MNTDCFIRPIRRASGWNAQCSPAHARPRYSTPSPIMKSVKSQLTYVSCIKLDSQPGGLITMTSVTQSVVAIVATNGPDVALGKIHNGPVVWGGKGGTYSCATQNV